MDKLLELFVSGEYDIFLEELEKMPTHKIDAFIIHHLSEWIEENKADKFSDEYGVEDYLYDCFSKKQWSKFQYLQSQERTRQFIINKAKEQGDDALTDEDWADLRATDF